MKNKLIGLTIITSAMIAVAESPVKADVLKNENAEVNVVDDEYNNLAENNNSIDNQDKVENNDLKSLDINVDSNIGENEKVDKNNPTIDSNQTENLLSDKDNLSSDLYNDIMKDENNNDTNNVDKNKPKKRSKREAEVVEPIEISIPEYGYEPYWRYNGNKKIILTSENKMQQETIKELEQNIVIYRYSDKNRFELYGFLIDGVKVPVSELGEYIFNKSVTITPIFKALYYEVSIHYDDKNNKSYSNTIRINDKKKKLEQKDIPDEEGIHYYYNDNPDKFLGWVINDGDKVYSREELLNMEIDKDMNIKPKNEKQKYTVKFSAQGEKHLHFEDKEFITKDAK